jgi:hypothetical protein
MGSGQARLEIERAMYCIYVTPRVSNVATLFLVLDALMELYWTCSLARLGFSLQNMNLSRPHLGYSTRNSIHFMIVIQERLLSCLVA